MESTLIKGLDIFCVLSNLAFFVPFGGALYWRRFTRAWLFFWQMWASFFYHLCDSFNACLFGFRIHHNLDFFHAQLLTITTVLYLVDFSRRQVWLERGLIFLAGVVVIILQSTLSAELYVQVAIVGTTFLGIVVYWLIHGVPRYNWSMLLLGISLISGSAMLYAVQDIWPNGYWADHSVWHVAAAFGQFFWLQIKPRPAPYLGLDRQIGHLHPTLRKI